MNDFNSIGLAMLGCLVCGVATGAHAQTNTVGASTDLEFKVGTTIAPRCGWASGGAPASSVNLGSLDVAGNQDVPFEVDCNTPFTITASSRNHALNRASQIEGLPEFFTQSIDYKLNIRVGVRKKDGAAVSVNDTCSVDQLDTESGCSFSLYSGNREDFIGDGVATSADRSLPRSRLRASWQAPSVGGPTRVAGTYSDVLTVSVEAKS